MAGAQPKNRIGVWDWQSAGVRGKYLVGNLPASVRVKAICDCARSRMSDTLEPEGVFKPLLARFRETDAPRCATYQDNRRLLDREKLDAVIIATPDHHHVPATMRALSVCIRSRGVPNAPVEAGHRTATTCHLANIARELNRPFR